ncbi:MAG: AAA domain-containing protein [candidate division WS1 bacterium]|jgi:MoxR-like ATPase|nr:AAA domain-containing protein [candidate division WS1 bacterium]
MNPVEETITELTRQIEQESRFLDDIRQEMGRLIVGQPELIEGLLVALLADGHALLEGVPGLAKTMTACALTQCIGGAFQRIQFTPDLLPGDITGTMIYNEKEHEFYAKLGPIFANFVLADEINRAPAKVQSALLEAMQERQVTIGEQTYPLPKPFLVLATQNPIEQEGTYPLPEAQVDRFMFKIKITYPSKEEELHILQRWTTGEQIVARDVCSVEQVLRARELVNAVYVDEKVQRYIVDLVFATREPAQYDLDALAPLIEYGASPRASIYLTLGAKAHAFTQHRGYVTPDDVLAVGMDVLRHRVICSYEAEAQEITSDDIVQTIFRGVEIP